MFANVRPTLVVTACLLLLAGAAGAQTRRPARPAPAAPAGPHRLPGDTAVRARPPKPGPPPALRVPKWTRDTLSNGAELYVTERHELPLVAFRIDIVGGADQFEPADKDGLAGFTAAMLDEGTQTRTGDQISDALQLLGTDIGAGIGGESGSLSFLVTRNKLQPTLEILADLLLHPSFPEDALERLRARSLVALQQAKDRTASIAGRVFPRVIYGEAHPYGRSTTEESVKRITREDLVAFHRAYFQPGRAVVTVAGDVEPGDVKSLVESTLVEWKSGGTRPSFDYPPVPAPKSTTIFLVDKPGAAQSTFSLGFAGPPRNTPDYFALRVMNSIFGELFQSRLNANIREQKGYSYGVSSRFGFGKGPGPFRAGGDIVTEKSAEALVEFMKELRGARGGRPWTEEEMEQGKASLIQALPETFASTEGTAAAISALAVQDLPQDYYQHFEANVKAVTKADLLRVAQKYLDLDHLNIVIVGDRSKIEAPLRATKIAPIQILDLEGNPVSAAAGS